MLMCQPPPLCRQLFGERVFILAADGVGGVGQRELDVVGGLVANSFLACHKGVKSGVGHLGV